MNTVGTVLQTSDLADATGYVLGIVIGLLIWYVVLSAIVRKLDAERVWVARGVWVVIGLLVLGNLAEQTPGNAVDATAAPIVTVALLLVVVASYPVVKRLTAV